ncbi:isoeugenol monooxygenase [Bisporella sp. PMI_857]|nr:isoeugenol monooxygenase [Bisporella sp. PMI_857]
MADPLYGENPHGVAALQKHVSKPDQLNGTHDKPDDIHNHFGLKSLWEQIYRPSDTAPHGRFECEMDDLVVYGEIPKTIDGTWYRVHPDSNTLPPLDFPFVDGDGIVSAYRFKKGQVSMKVKYVETERYLLERNAGRQLFGRYRNPYDNHPCLRLANDTTANTNVVYWGGDLLAISERGLPYALDPDTLETTTFDPYGGQVAARTFTAHPKIDPYKNELVTWAYAAKGLHSPEICTYSVDPNGKTSNEFWFTQDKPGWPHDGWVTENWIILANMPFAVNSDEEMHKPGADHWIFVPGQSQEFLVAPRHPNTLLPHGWKRGEFRKYTTDHGLIIHTGNAWEEADGKLMLESPWMTFNTFKFWNPPGYEEPERPTSDWVRWTINLDQPDGSKLPPPKVLYTGMTEFPAIDERFLTHKTKIVYMNTIGVDNNGAARFDSILKLNTETGEFHRFHAAEGGSLAEPVFIPRSDTAPEGDGWVLFYSSRPTSPKGELILLDTEDFSRPVAVIQLPYAARNQVHGNWVPNPHPGETLPPLGKPFKNVRPSVKYGPLTKLQ